MITSEDIKKQIVIDFWLMPEYHTNIFELIDYQKTLSSSNWKRKYKNGNIRQFDFTPFSGTVTATSYDDGERILDIQYIFHTNNKGEIIF